METETIVDFVPTEAFTAFASEADIEQARVASAQPTFVRFNAPEVHADIPPIEAPKAVEPARSADEPFWSGVLIGGGSVAISCILLYFLFVRLRSGAPS
ncbi:MAG: hypothetical protein ACPGR8_06365 [Limisphaerales bacterium]